MRTKLEIKQRIKELEHTNGELLDKQEESDCVAEISLLGERRVGIYKQIQQLLWVLNE